MNNSTNIRSVTFRAICTNGVFRIRTRATVGPQNDSLNRTVSRASAVFQSAAILPSMGSGRLREPVEHGGPSHVLRAPAFLLRNAGTIARRICKLRGGFKALRSLSFRSRVKFCQEPGRVQSILFRPNYVNALSSLAAHVPEHAARSVGNVGKAVGESGNV